MIDANPEESIRNMAKPVVVAYILDCFLYGITLLQVYIYYLSFPGDLRWQKALVYILFSVCTFQTVMQMRDMVEQFAQNFGNQEAFSRVPLGAVFLPMNTGIVSCGIQLFYVYQIYVVSRSKILRASIAFLSVLQMLSSIVQSIRAFHFRDYPTLRRKTFIQFTTWLIGSAACDVIIAIVMTFYLLRANSGFRKTHAPLRKLSFLMIETGTVCATAATAACIIFLIAPNYTVHHIFMKSLANLYLNTLLVILNSRIWIVGGREAARLDNQSVHINPISTGSVIDEATIRKTGHLAGSAPSSIPPPCRV